MSGVHAFTVPERLCLALVNRLTATARTADAAWRDLPDVQLIR